LFNFFKIHIPILSNFPSFFHPYRKITP